MPRDEGLGPPYLRQMEAAILGGGYDGLQPEGVSIGREEMLPVPGRELAAQLAEL
jgi:hypothetical protein